MPLPLTTNTNYRQTGLNKTSITNERHINRQTLIKIINAKFSGRQKVTSDDFVYNNKKQNWDCYDYGMCNIFPKTNMNSRQRAQTHPWVTARGVS